MENIDKLIKELESSILEAKKKKKQTTNDDKGRIVRTLMTSELENAEFELQLSYSGINQLAEITLRNIPCGNDPRIFLDAIKNGVKPVIGIPKEDISIKLVYDEGFNRY